MLVTLGNLASWANHSVGRELCSLEILRTGDGKMQVSDQGGDGWGAGSLSVGALLDHREGIQMQSP